MATFSDGRSHHSNGDVNGDALSSARTMRQHLNRLLERKETQLQQAGTLGQRVLAQRVELEERIRQLQDLILERDEDDEVSAELRMRYRDLTSTLGAWDDENTALSGVFGSNVRLSSCSSTCNPFSRNFQRRSQPFRQTCSQRTCLSTSQPKDRQRRPLLNRVARRMLLIERMTLVRAGLRALLVALACRLTLLCRICDRNRQQPLT